MSGLWYLWLSGHPVGLRRARDRAWSCYGSGSCRRGSGAGVGRGFSGNEQLGVLWPPFDGCVHLLLLSGIDGRCRAVWRQVWPLQGCLAASMAAAGPLQCRYTRPLLMMPLLWNSSSCLQAYCCLLAWFQTRTRIMRNCNLAVVYCCIGAADTGWHWLEEVWSKFCILIIQSFAVSIEKLGSVL